MVRTNRLQAKQSTEASLRQRPKEPWEPPSRAAKMDATAAKTERLIGKLGLAWGRPNHKAHKKAQMMETGFLAR